MSKRTTVNKVKKSNGMKSWRNGCATEAQQEPNRIVKYKYGAKKDMRRARRRVSKDLVNNPDMD